FAILSGAPRIACTSSPVWPSLIVGGPGAAACAGAEEPASGQIVDPGGAYATVCPFRTTGTQARPSALAGALSPGIRTAPAGPYPITWPFHSSGATAAPSAGAEGVEGADGGGGVRTGGDAGVGGGGACWLWFCCALLPAFSNFTT